MRQKIIELFTFTKNERLGLIVLIVLIILVIVFRYTAAYFIQPEPENFEKHKQEIEQFLASLQPKEDEEYLSRLDKFIIERYDSLVLFNFDPNKTSKESWLKLGLTQITQ